MSLVFLYIMTNAAGLGSCIKQKIHSRREGEAAGDMADCKDLAECTDSAEGYYQS